MTSDRILLEAMAMRLVECLAWPESRIYENAKNSFRYDWTVRHHPSIASKIYTPIKAKIDTAWPRNPIFWFMPPVLRQGVRPTSVLASRCSSGTLLLSRPFYKGGNSHKGQDAPSEIRVFRIIGGLHLYTSRRNSFQMRSGQ